MKFYLSSFKLGDEIEKLKSMIPENKKAVYIFNAFDFSDDLEHRKTREQTDANDLRDVGLDVEILDLRDYFGKREELEKKLEEYGVWWVSGGNTFVLRQAMKLSGFDEIVLNSLDKDVLYGGYSAGVCVLGPSLKGTELVDDPGFFPYEGQKEVIWDGLGILDFAFVPHYKSDHPESADIDKEVAYYEENNIAHKKFRDGEVLVIE